MGCTNSKLDELPAVVLCRNRCNFINEAIRYRYSFAEAHVAYIDSLKVIGFSLDRLFSQDLVNSPPSPVLPLPPHRKGDPVVPVEAVKGGGVSVSSPPPYHQHHSHSHSNSGSHLQFHSDSEDDDDDDEDEDGHIDFHDHEEEEEDYSGNLSTSHYNNNNNNNNNDRETLGSMQGGFMNMSMNYMRNKAIPSVVYQQRPISPETVHMGGGSYSDYPNQENPNPYQYYNNYAPSYPPPYGNDGFYGSAAPYGSSQPPRASEASTSKPPPPPPSPPRTSPWDFLNPFPYDSVEKYYTSNTPSRDSKEVREEEGIPDLEDDNYQHEVVKEVHGKQKFKNVSDGNVYSKMGHDEVHEKGKNVEETFRGKRPSGASTENDGMEYEVHVVEKKVVGNEERSMDQDNVTAFKAQGGGSSRGVNEVMREIKVQFDRASESGNEVSQMLEVGKVHYPRRNVVYQVSSKMLHSVTPSLSVISSQTSTSKSAESSSSTEQTSAGSVFSGFEEDTGMRSGNLSSTLLKLKIWEKKLYDEVKAEEKLRVVHERKSRRLKDLDKKGAEAHKVDSTRTLVRSLSTKIRIAIQVVDKISIKINTLRDEELWPQINELINGLIMMWKVMVECHHNQCQAIAEAKNLDAIASSGKLSDAHFEVIKQLELELLRWTSNFRGWVTAQKEYIKALNGWLLKCLFIEREETADGVVPFSPGRIGAPPVFVICNQWAQSMEDIISEEEVLQALRGFALSVRYLRERHNTELRMRTMVDTKALERDELKMQKEWQKVDKELVLLGRGPVHIMHTSDTANISSLQLGLKQIFEAMERFTANSMSVYEQLRVRSEEERLAQENSKVP
ncbi:hypothetical protein GIB67_038246 [Kingdonia uniflora]|uniref:BZIP transcription factor n=1 Tax=Kingdonia uniflora TaxID=39325 RepID=A0A7J7MSV5_9MAGN|nr:hypothetical protein GIB67_038246 [Kingdonia uniflora]